MVVLKRGIGYNTVMAWNPKDMYFSHVQVMFVYLRQFIIFLINSVCFGHSNMKNMTKVITFGSQAGYMEGAMLKPE